MKHFYFVKITILFFTLFNTSLNASLTSKSAIVYYGDNIPYSLVGIHDFIILEPQFINVYTSGFKTYKDNIYAYVSINEMLKSRPFAKEIDKRWIIGKNGAWGSMILDIKNPNYQNFLLDRVIGELYKKGIKNFFFDTIDSYQLAKVSKKQKEKLRLGLIKFIKKFKHKYPNSKLIINRGFEIIDDVHPYIDAFLFESYYYGIDSSTMRYIKVSNRDREWLDIWLKKIKNYNIPIIALDYIPKHKKKRQLQTIKALQKRGFIPYVTTKELTDIGKGSKNAIKREVLIIYDRDKIEDRMINYSYAHRLASMPLEYLGYVPTLHDINTPLPKGDLSSRYAGIIVWLEEEYKNYNRFAKWIKIAISQNTKVLFVGDGALALNHPLSKELGINIEKNFAKQNSKIQIIKQDSMFNFEIRPYIHHHQYIIIPKGGKALFSYKNNKNQISTLAALMPWGGYIQNDLITSYFNDNNLWIVNPFKLFSKSLNLKSIPIADTTTESGKRLMFVHIDGDGSMNRVENNPKQLSIELILEEFIKPYTFPQSVSIVESETAPYGLYPKLSKRLEKAAKEMFKLPHIEGATHTFTHPFYWQKLEKNPNKKNYNIKIEGYTYSTNREIKGSIKYINERLIPKNRPKINTIFWTGDCSPSENILEYTYANNIININGGDTIITNDRPWISLIQPLGLKLGDYYQIYTAQQNENIYTNDWQGPFWGFKKVIQTFNLTNKPRRLKPINIYYHFYSASKRASYIALKEIYNWANKQDVMHIFTSQYPAKVTDFYDISLAKENDTWLLRGFNHLRTLRVPKTLGYPKLDKSFGIAGYKNEKDYTYIHLDSKKSKFLTLGEKSKNENFLIESNARVISKNRNTLHLKSTMPLTLIYKLKKGCELYVKTSKKTIIKKEEIVTLNLKDAKEVYVTPNCKN